MSLTSMTSVWYRACSCPPLTSHFTEEDHQAMRSPFLFGAGFAIVGALALWTCGGSRAPSAPPPTPAPAPAPPPSSVTVNIAGSIGHQAYRPNPVAANSGDMVWVRNNDSAMHHI